MRSAIRCFGWLLFLALFAVSSPAADVPVPKGLEALKNAGTPEETLNAFLGIPYRDDGCLDEAGRYARFADTETFFPAPGLNCSGFTLAASRFLLRKNFTLAEVKKDRLGDSGPDAELGEDWDFGWDLVMNISQGSKRTMLLPGGRSMDPAKASGLSPLGFDLHDESTWKELPGRIREGRLYLVSFVKPVKKPGYDLQHYHVGLFYRASARDWYMYNTTGQSKKIYRRNLGTDDGLAAFLKAFANTGKARKRICVIEVELPPGK